MRNVSVTLNARLWSQNMNHNNKQQLNTQHTNKKTKNMYLKPVFSRSFKVHSEEPSGCLSSSCPERRRRRPVVSSRVFKMIFKL